MKKAIIYCRVSTKKQEKWVSLESQEEYCRNFCQNNNWQVIWVFKEAYSWKTTRPILEEAMNNAKQNNVDYFVIFDIDRFSREGFSVYEKIKRDLEKSQIYLRDSKNIIKEAWYIYKNDLVDMTKYNWNRDDSWEIAEVFVTTYAKTEWNKILQRTIPPAIQLEQQWYQVRWPKYWFKNKKIKINWNKKATIQVPEEPYYSWLIEIFESRAKWILSDKEIVDILNSKGAHKKNWNPLDVRFILSTIQNPIYAWVLITEWTWHNPIATAYPMLPIELFNQANRGKVFITKNINGIFVEKNIDFRKKMTKETKESFLFQWLLKYENRAMTPYITKKNKYYRSGRNCIPPFNISENKLIMIFENILDWYIISEAKKAEIENFAQEFIKSEKKNVQENIKNIKKEIEKIKTENKEIIKKWIKGLISDSIMSELLEENKNNIIEKEKLLKREIIISEIEESKVVELSKFLLNTKELWEKSNLYQKRELIKLIVVELQFTQKKELKIVETQLFKLLNNSFFL